MATASAANNGVCHLFRLSAELRNRIYRDVLVEDDWIPVDGRGQPGVHEIEVFAQPGLLRTCHQIRSEAISIYYLENDFLFEICEFDSNKLVAFCEQAGDFWKEKKMLHPFICESKMDWWTMVIWLRAYHAGLAPSCECGNYNACLREECLPFKLFELVDEVDPSRVMKWSRVEGIIGMAKDMARVGRDWPPWDYS